MAAEGDFPRWEGMFCCPGGLFLSVPMLLVPRSFVGALDQELWREKFRVEQPPRGTAKPWRGCISMRLLMKCCVSAFPSWYVSEWDKGTRAQLWWAGNEHQEVWRFPFLPVLSPASRWASQGKGSTVNLAGTSQSSVTLSSAFICGWNQPLQQLPETPQGS